MKTYVLTEKDIERLLKSFDNGSDSWWFEMRVDEWVETLPTKEEFASIITEIINDSKYKPKNEHPKEISINTYWNNGGQVSTLREALPYDHPENLYNWFIRTYPDLNPEYYDIYKPERLISADKVLKRSAEK